jgi:2-haloacid dehalogenase
MSERWATFDCYGTLIDWEGGIRATFAELWPGADVDALAGLFHDIEPQVQAGRGIPYRQVLAETLKRVGTESGLVVPPRRTDALAVSLPTWPVFPEVPAALRELRSRRWKLAVLSNTDPDLLATSLYAIGVAFDHTITASEIGSYKPAFGHWEAFFRATGARRPDVVHVGASLYHDVEPCSRLGLNCVWINRLGETSSLPRAGELPNLSELPDTLDAILEAEEYASPPD